MKTPKTKLSAFQRISINTYLKAFHSERRNIGQTDDSTEGKGVHYFTKDFDGTRVCFRYCSPEHKGDEPAIYYFVVTN